MQLFYGVPEDLDNWMTLVRAVKENFPGLETPEALAEHQATVLRFMAKQEAICVKDEQQIVGVMLFSRKHNMICFLAVLPLYRRRGVASKLMDEALYHLDQNKEITVTTFCANDEKGPAPRALYEKYGFIPDACLEEFGYPNQKYVLHPNGSERKNRQIAINRMVHEISQILIASDPVIYLYGSAVLNDFRLGWSDLDILVLTAHPITAEQAHKLLVLRQTMLEREPDNPYYRSFEGGMLTVEAFLSKQPDRVVYWGTSGQKITNQYTFDSFSMRELLTNGLLLYGHDIRKQFKSPTFQDLYTDILHHYQTIRKYIQKTGRDFYAYGWMLDIARCLYTLQTGQIIAKTEAAKWALNHHLCPDPDVLNRALEVRQEPLKHQNQATFDYAETLAEPIQRFADALEKALRERN